MGNSVTTFAMIALLIVAFYFLILRPQKKRQQAQQKTMNELVPGTRVLLGSGVFGTLTWVGTKQARMETSPGTEITVLKQAIARVVNPGDEYSEPVDADPLDRTEAVNGVDEAEVDEPADLGPYATERPVENPMPTTDSAEHSPNPTASKE
jgi:preprotein translocase YajC subunit